MLASRERGGSGLKAFNTKTEPERVSPTALRNVYVEHGGSHAVGAQAEFPETD